MAENTYLIGYQEGNQTKLGLQKGTQRFKLDPQQVPSFQWLMQNVPAADLLSTLENATTEALPDGATTTLKGLLQQEPIWAAGVTYKVSEEARERESDNSTVYTRVYSAERPEIFWKSIGYEALGTGDYVGIRADASWSVPEPELTIVFNARHEVVGFTIGNDMSSRDIEGENPLYLPQAKVYDDACALGPGIWLQPGAQDCPHLEIGIKIVRDNEIVFSGTTSTARLNRTLQTLAEYLGRCKRFPYGVLLMTGTGLVPPDTFTLVSGDVVQISIESIGELVNTVHVVGR
jgi:2-dehydro-3-deoxy-D-arabinonate dehydratase